MIKIAVLITCHNRKNKTIKCLKALFNQNDIKNISLKVFLVDDGSIDGTDTAVNKLFPNIIVVRGDGNLFWARGMSLAWQEALKSNDKFDYYLWLNDDTYLKSTAINELINTQKSSSDIITGSCCDPTSKRRTYGGTKFVNKFLTPFKYKVIDVNGAPQEIDTINGNVVLIPHSTYNKIGTIDNFFEHAYADVEYSLRAIKKNIKILLTANHVAECEAKVIDYESYYKMSFFEKIYNLFSRKEKPPKSWLRLCYKHGGVLWPIHFFVGYIKSIIKILLEHKFLKKN
tara:strand:+ start:2058 stop:2915 length:858 start_codon:yes stop_codon:yes gene_type:complete